MLAYTLCRFQWDRGGKFYIWERDGLSKVGRECGTTGCFRANRDCCCAAHSETPQLLNMKNATMLPFPTFSSSRLTQLCSHSARRRVCMCMKLGAYGASSDKPSTLRCHWTYPPKRGPRQVFLHWAHAHTHKWKHRGWVRVRGEALWFMTCSVPAIFITVIIINGGYDSRRGQPAVCVFDETVCYYSKFKLVYFQLQ